MMTKAFVIQRLNISHFHNSWGRIRQECYICITMAAQAGIALREGI